MLIVGLTGGIASGKSTVATLFEDLGAIIIDADVIAREVVATGSAAYQSIVQHFGTSVLHPDQTLNRRALRDIVFANPQQRIWLEDLLHPLIRQAMNERAAVANGPYVLLVIPLLTDRRHYPAMQRVLLVDAPLHLQLQRVCERDDISLVQAKAMLAAQSTREDRLALADDIIINDGNLNHLRDQVHALDQQYRHAR